MTVSSSLHHSILREYDIRGIVEETLFVDDIRVIGQTFGSIIYEEFGQKATVVAGYDGRLSSPNLFAALSDGLIKAGVNVIDVGIGPSPMIYFAAHQINAHAGMVITGSHNPPNYNGVKMVIGGRPFYGKDIQLLGDRIKNSAYRTGKGALEYCDIRYQYVDRLLEGNTLVDNIKVGWDPANGAAGEIVKLLIERLGGKHFLINNAIDGNFPNHHPDPTVESNLSQLKNIVAEKNCDLGISFDGDGDRIGVVDSKGRVIWGDQLMIILARDVLSNLPGSTIIADVKTSSVFYEEVKKLGGNPVMWKTGHSLIKSKMVELNAPLAGEMSGHIFFADEYYGFDDAIYAALRLLRILTRENLSLDKLRDSLPIKFNTPEYRFHCSDERKFAIVDQVRRRMKDDHTAEICDIDGIRVLTKDGWWLLRASNTQPVLVARCESDTEIGLSVLKEIMKEQLILSGIKVPNFG